MSGRRAATLLGVLLGTAGAGCGANEPPPRPNVLWISLDTLRADRLSCYGNARATSPAIDRLASEGAVFERALSTTSWTLPAHVSMLTGLPISAHGVCFHDYGEAPSPLRGTFVSEVLRDAGYATAGFWAHSYVDHATALGAGFDTWERTGRVVRRSAELREEWEAAQAAGDDAAVKRVRVQYNRLFREERFEADDAVDRSIAWLEAQRATRPEQPFLLFLHVFDVHSPYDPPDPYDEVFDPDYTGPLHPVNVDDADRPVRTGMDPRDLEHVLALYDGEIAWVDAQVERLLRSLDALELADDTLVILTSDHGEEFLEHGRSGHHKALYRESLHVPLVLRLPGRIPAGARVSAPVSLVDLVPTVLDLLELQPLPGLPGVDLAALARGEPAPSRTLVGELVVVEDGAEPARVLSLYRADEHVLVHELGTPRERAVRYDLRSNPLEVGPGEPVGEEGWPAISERLEELRRRTRASRDAARTRENETLALSEAEQAELEALGYGGFGDEAGGRTGDALCMDGCVWR